MIAAWALVTGVFEIVAAARLRKYIEGEWLLALSGVLSIIFGVLAAVLPLIGILTIVLWIGAYACALGIVLIVLGFKLRSWMRRLHVDEHRGDFPAVAPTH